MITDDARAEDRRSHAHTRYVRTEATDVILPLHHSIMRSCFISLRRMRKQCVPGSLFYFPQRAREPGYEVSRPVDNTKFTRFLYLNSKVKYSIYGTT